MNKINRKMKKKLFEKLTRTENPFRRIDKWGRVIDFHEYGKKTEMGWLVVDGEAVHIGTVKVINSWENTR